MHSLLSTTPPAAVVTHGENGRAIMTRQLAKGVKERLGVDGQNVRNILHKAAMKMLFKQRMSTTMNGPAHDQTFITTVRTVVPQQVTTPSKVRRRSNRRRPRRKRKRIRMRTRTRMRLRLLREQMARRRRRPLQLLQQI